ncbi:MAG TPA: 4a-hydroxytetrahydrobiopterin dehydratase [Candidatus Binataceae bacterium]|nr:4a-hydroxytetrahydrobiopterin dehydratase [Candidatus Binataceae bacterium]
MAQLSNEAIERGLNALPGWKLHDGAIAKQFRCSGFAAAMALVNWVAWQAEAADHHPDILINYNRVTFTCSTHSEGGVTDKDLALAAAIERSAQAAQAS